MPYKASHHNAHPYYMCINQLEHFDRRTLDRWFQIGIEPLDMEDVYWILWNTLPSYIKSADTLITFKTNKKTYMFIN